MVEVSPRSKERLMEQISALIYRTSIRQKERRFNKLLSLPITKIVHLKKIDWHITGILPDVVYDRIEMIALFFIHHYLTPQKDSFQHLQ